MLSRRKTKLNRRSGERPVFQEILGEIMLNELDHHWRKYGEGFDDEGLMLRTMLIRLQTDPDQGRRQLSESITMPDLEQALGTAKRSREIRAGLARGIMPMTLTEFLNELRDDGNPRTEFPSKANFVSYFRNPTPYDFDRGIVSDEEIGNVWKTFYRAHGKEIIPLIQRKRERQTVVEGVADFLRDVVAGSSALQATIDLVRDVLGDIVGTAADTGQARTDARQREGERMMAAFRRGIAARRYTNPNAVILGDAGYGNYNYWPDGPDPPYWPESEYE